MEEFVVTTQDGSRRWAGIDWGKESHAVCVVDDDRRQVAAFSVEATPQGYAELASRLHEFAPVGGVAIEAARNLVIAFLVEAGFTVYPVNPKVSKTWRAAVSVSEVKSDGRDGQVLALELARRHESLTPLLVQDPDAVELASLCEKRRTLVNARTAQVQRLEALLAQYHPAALAFFDDWSSPVAWRFVKRFSNPAKLVKARKDTLIRFLKSNRIGLKPKWLERIDQRATALNWPTPPDAGAVEALVMATVGQLQALQPHIDRFDRLIEEKAKALTETEIVATAKGAGPILTPELTAILVDPAAKTGGYEALRGLAGTAPVTHQSGRQRHVSIRRRCNKCWRNTLHLFAYSSLKQSLWARAYYRLLRDRGDGFATALRKLADKWLKILVRMVERNEPYDEQRHIESLRRRNSPVYQKLREEACA